MGPKVGCSDSVKNQADLDYRINKIFRIFNEHGCTGSDKEEIFLKILKG